MYIFESPSFIVNNVCGTHVEIYNKGVNDER
jgi:hypothetical protein